MKKQPTLLFYFLAAYVVLQFSWWAYHIVELTKEVGYDQAAVSKRIAMIIGEGLVFFLILIFGIWRIIRSIKKEHELAKRQHNFLLSVTHELKTPLASTKLYLQTLLKRNFDAEKREELLTKTLQENERLEEIVEAILISARLENRAYHLHKEKIALNKEFQKLIDHFHAKHAKNFIEFDVKEEFTLYSDLFMIKTIVINLLSNAIKYAGIEEKITLSLRKENENILIQIKDFGPGISQESQQSIFQKFVRLENEETRSKKGTGLGLFIVKEFTSLCGGQISYNVNQPKGSIFEISIPLS